MGQMALNFDSGYGYDDELQELNVAKYYRQQLLLGDKLEQSESLELYDYAIKEISDFIVRNKQIKRVINFGVSFGYIDSVLAKKFPDIAFVGIDRSILTKSFNEENFGDISNLSFKAQDIFEFLKTEDFNNSLLIHIRTLTVLPEKFVADLYRSASNAGINFIAGFEQCGVSRQTNAPFNFSDAYKESVVYRTIMLIHNYPELLKRFGYNIIGSELLKTRHKDEDYRILAFKAKK